MEEIIDALRQADVALSQGKTVEESFRGLGITVQACYRRGLYSFQFTGHHA